VRGDGVFCWSINASVQKTLIRALYCRDGEYALAPDITLDAAARAEVIDGALKALNEG